MRGSFKGYITQWGGGVKFPRKKALQRCTVQCYQHCHRGGWVGVHFPDLNCIYSKSNSNACTVETAPSRITLQQLITDYSLVYMLLQI